MEDHHDIFSQECVLEAAVRTVFFSFVSRCYILENDTVQCDMDLYKSLQAWKDHKLHIDHEVSDSERFI